MTKIRTKVMGIEEQAEAIGVDRKVTEKGMRQVPGGDLGLTVVQLGRTYRDWNAYTKDISSKVGSGPVPADGHRPPIPRLDSRAN